ncbi:MAG: methylated-DNA--[protein]-cysteine S-methyltransferase [Mariprofundaceae bacterium]
MNYSFKSDLGWIHYQWDGLQCKQVNLNDKEVPNQQHDDPVSVWLSAYFSGDNRPLLQLSPAKTLFQGRLRQALCCIPSGTVKTYGELAKELNTAPQALGQALGANPIALIIPCHRIIAAHDLGGYHYGEIWKQKLLNFEQGLMKLKK